MVFRLRVAVSYSPGRENGVPFAFSLKAGELLHEINPKHLLFDHTRCWVTAFAQSYGSEELAAVVRTYANPSSRYLWTLLQPGLQAVALDRKICDIPTVYNGRYNI